MIYYCCDERRRNEIMGLADLNGIDFLEVVDNKSDPYEHRQRILLVHFINVLTPGDLNKENICIEGGDRIRNIKVVDAAVRAIGSPPLSSPPIGQNNVLVVEVEVPGDFSTYTLHIVQDAEHKDPPDGFDPILSVIDFSFKVACPSDFDCKPKRICPEESGASPDINYLAKDYASFRQLMLDRMSLLLPQWKERNPADPGIALVELLASVGDYLSYRQDVIATEAYLGTARRRVSVRRHARLADYFMHDGCNARVWVQIFVSMDNVLPNKTQLMTKVEGLKDIRILDESDQCNRAINLRPEVFETMYETTLFVAHNEISFYTWSNQECCLPKGASCATLKGNYPDLQPGDILIFKEKLDPNTGKEEDADLTRRHVVCLNRVVFKDENDLDLTDPLNGQLITEIEWHGDDALPFPFCISSRNGTAYYDEVSIALGNIVLADHGQTLEEEELDEVPASNPVLTKVITSEEDRCNNHAAALTPPRFRPILKSKPITHAAPYDVENPPPSAHEAMVWSMQSQGLLPAISLSEPGFPENWGPRRDLLNSRGSDKHFLLEFENNGDAFIRFGDDQHGSQPVSGTKFKAIYRIGNGTSGNVGAETITHIVSVEPSIIKVWNPLPAKGGFGPESIEEVRQNAPNAFRRQERAVTPEDYAEMAKRCDSSVQHAAATFRWTGSWHTAFVTVDRFEGEEVDEVFENDMRQCLEKYRMAGQDLEVDGPRYVSLEVEMIVCVKQEYFKSDVQSALGKIFSNSILPDGGKGVFHTDNFTFGQTVYLSPLYAAAQSTTGVASVKITKFQRQGIDSNEAIENGKLKLGRLEIARLDNDPNFRERGVLNLIMRGGR